MDVRDYFGSQKTLVFSGKARILLHGLEHNLVDRAQLRGRKFQRIPVPPYPLQDLVAVSPLHEELGLWPCGLGRLELGLWPCGRLNTMVAGPVAVLSENGFGWGRRRRR